MRNALFQEIRIRGNSKNARYHQNASKNVRHLKELWTFRKMFLANSSEYDLLDSPKWPSVLSEDAILFAAERRVRNWTGLPLGFHKSLRDPAELLSIISPDTVQSVKWPCPSCGFKLCKIAGQRALQPSMHSFVISIFSTDLHKHGSFVM